MAELTKIDSNVTGLRYAEEASLGVLPVTPVWYPLEPNSYNDFGGEITTVARNPINPSRQQKKGVVTDLDASGGFETDVTQTNLQDLLQGFFFADLRRKEEYGGGGEISAVATSDDSYAGTDIEDNMQVGDLVLATGFTDTTNNGLKTVAGVTGPNKITVSENLADETPGATAKLVVVGHQFVADDLNVVAGATYPTITSDAAFDFTTLGLIPGEWIFVGGDTSATQFATAGNNGFKRVRSVTATAITLDKGVAMTSESLSGGETVQIFFGRVLKNEAVRADQVRRSYNLERTLGAPDDAEPAEEQAEYLEGQVASELTLNIPTAEKVTTSLAFMGLDNTQIDGPTALKTGTRPALVEADAFNTSSDIPRIKMSVHSTTDEAPDPLFAFMQELTLTINNSLTINKAVGVLGGFEVTAGTFVVSGEITAYFANVAAVQAVRNNSDVTLDVHFAKANAGISIDVPLVALGNGRLEVAQDEPITLPLSLNAATGAKLDTSLDHTLLMVFYDYLPDAAG